ncbi:bifunctional nicotinamidase/pyrazinamidase [Azotobacter beijerinckii]|uniref:bifunctional nicotinamidase/pyrazinamidase n=1 Tax=Azotobacter beijerinckii TaxID=170623 RepID=UPI0029538C77|nr:bifunctional nicotinamidase/pyrazinamidase [Azotobacter beijerinckii]MDV7214146.1 bifunctional nicotinamidase/pyrazinamidase [Azotobacter beijerinckii]
MTRLPSIGEGDLLLVIDLQNDFCAGGALAVAGADELVPTINRLAEGFAHVALTQDWHPPGHRSFAASHPGRRPFETVRLAYGEQTLWPEHCVQGTPGAEFHPELAIPQAELILRKGYRAEVDSYSAFHENDRCTPTGLAGYLRERGLRRLFLAGLATDVCVHYTALDARLAGFETVLLLDACRAIDCDGSLAAALEAMRAAGVEILG